MTIEEKKEYNRKAQERYRNTEKGKAYMEKWRSENREHYLKYQRDASKKRYQEYKNVSGNKS